MREAQSRGDKLKMSDEEIAFYDALEVNDSAVKVLGDGIVADCFGTCRRGEKERFH
jgi:type I restriction enzyme R subunit